MMAQGHARRLALLVSVAAFLAAATAQDGRAALFFFFEPTAVDAGGLATVRTAGTPLGFGREQRVKPFAGPIRLYLVPNRIAASVHSRFDRRLHFVGSLVPDARGRGILIFRAPPLASDTYVVAAWCRHCARYSGGSTFSVLPVDEDVVPGYRPPMALRLRTRATAESCPVTARSGDRTVHGTYGNGLLASGAGGVVGYRVEADGSIFDKLGWFPTGIAGRMTVSGERLDGPSPPLDVLGVYWGYSSNGRGSWASAVRFPRPGCWRVTARVQDVSLAIVAIVRGS